MRNSTDLLSFFLSLSDPPKSYGLPRPDGAPAAEANKKVCARSLKGLKGSVYCVGDYMGLDACKVPCDPISENLLKTHSIRRFSGAVRADEQNFCSTEPADYISHVFNNTAAEVNRLILCMEFKRVFVEDNLGSPCLSKYLTKTILAGFGCVLPRRSNLESTPFPCGRIGMFRDGKFQSIFQETLLAGDRTG